MPADFIAGLAVNWVANAIQAVVVNESEAAALLDSYLQRAAGARG